MGKYMAAQEKVLKSEEDLSKPNKLVSVGCKSGIAADGADAVVQARFVPRPSNKKEDLKPPSRKVRQDGEHLKEEERWCVEGKAMHEKLGQLRNESLSNKTAQVYWNRLLLLVTAVDKRTGGSLVYRTISINRWWLPKSFGTLPKDWFASFANSLCVLCMQSFGSESADSRCHS